MAGVSPVIEYQFIILIYLMYLRDTFVIFDKDGDGTIDSKELSTVLRAMGYNPSKVRQNILDNANVDDLMMKLMNRDRP